MTTQASAVTQITDPFVLSFHTQRINAYNEARTQITNFYEELDSSVTQIKVFTAEVRAEGGKLQDGDTDVLQDLSASCIGKPKEPSETELIKQKNDYLSQYHKFKTIYERSTVLAINIASTIAFLTPIKQVYSDQHMLETDQPELLEQIKQAEEICSKKISTLQTSLDKVRSLNGRLSTSLNDSELTWSLQRFCAIVDNKGKPLSGWDRFSIGKSYYFGSDIPKPDAEIQTAEKPSVNTNNTEPKIDAKASENTNNTEITSVEKPPENTNSTQDSSSSSDTPIVLTEVKLEDSTSNPSSEQKAS